jgi:hypothetical protein
MIRQPDPYLQENPRQSHVLHNLRELTGKGVD